MQELKELRLEAYESARIYKEKTRLLYDRALIKKDIKVVQKVLYNSSLKLMPSKLSSNWLGSFEVTNVFSYGGVKIKSSEIEKEFKVKGHCLKIFNEEEVDPYASVMGLAIPPCI